MDDKKEERGGRSDGEVERKKERTEREEEEEQRVEKRLQTGGAHENTINLREGKRGNPYRRSLCNCTKRASLTSAEPEFLKESRELNEYVKGSRRDSTIK